MSCVAIAVLLPGKRKGEAIGYQSQIQVTTNMSLFLLFNDPSKKSWKCYVITLDKVVLKSWPKKLSSTSKEKYFFPSW